MLIASDYLETQVLIPVDASLEMSNCVLAVMNAALTDSPEQIRKAPVMGFVYIADVDSEKQRLKVLAPVSARLGDRPLIWGQWPEPFISLLG
jgi:polyribonucleotide 5'-hydroxyl-kinase